ncbi:hypothetical protein V5T82_14065 [Magnetovibrio sp. PR-2]|uniref:hypothetical protein n=1 Tax=Magnetovibrio sp. PR-2 TaxID=3120356 RepID=UPI002FCE123B
MSTLEVMHNRVRVKASKEHNRVPNALELYNELMLDTDIRRLITLLGADVEHIDTSKLESVTAHDAVHEYVKHEYDCLTHNKQIALNKYGALLQILEIAKRQEW